MAVTGRNSDSVRCFNCKRSIEVKSRLTDIMLSPLDEEFTEIRCKECGHKFQIRYDIEMNTTVRYRNKTEKEELFII